MSSAPFTEGCPFCGAEGTEVVEVPIGHIDYAHVVRCGICCARGPLKLHKEDAVTAWNRRCGR